MNKLKRWGMAAALLCLGLFQAGEAGAAAPKNTYKPASGGYTLTVPPGSKEIYHTSTGIRFTVGKDFLVSADLYTLPSFVSVPMKQYSTEQKKDFKKFLGKIQDQETTPSRMTAAPGISAASRPWTGSWEKSSESIGALPENRNPKRTRRRIWTAIPMWRCRKTSCGPTGPF